MTIPALYSDTWHPNTLPVSLILQGDSLVFEVLFSGNSRELIWRNSEVSFQKHPRDKSIILTFKGQADATLVIARPHTRTIQRWLRSRDGKDRRLTKILSSSILIGILLFFISIVPIAYFILIPVAAGFLTEELPKEKEVEMGDQVAREILKTSVEIPAYSALCNQFVNNLGPKFQFPLNLHVVQSDDLNAFSLPGGEIFINSALLKSCRTKDELAALLSHEIGHVELRHSSKAVFQNILSSAMISFVSGQFNSFTEVAASKANELKHLEYSRELELEADQFSLRILKQSNLNPTGLTDLFQTFQTKDQKDSELPEMLSTHPLTETRITMAQKEIGRINAATQLPNDSLNTIFTQIKSSSQTN